MAKMLRMTTPASRDPRRYVRLAAALRAQILDGSLTAGARLPSIAALCRQHGISRHTAGKALHLLEEQDLVQRVPGLGYHVS
jgi:DNA-binding GntR family transcriptional regulator